MTLQNFADEVLELLDYSTEAKKKTDRRNIYVLGDSIRNEHLAAGHYSATLVNGQWQYNIGNDVKELPDILFMSVCIPVLFNQQRQKCYSILPGEIVTFKNKTGIKFIKGVQTNQAQQGANINLQSDRTDFINQGAGTGVAYGLLESANLAGGIGYEIEFLSGTPGIILYNNMQQAQWPNVLINYMPRLWNGGLKETDMMPMDDTFTRMLIEATAKLMTPQKMSSRDKVEGE